MATAKKTASKKRPRTAAQKAATARMLAARRAKLSPIPRNPTNRPRVNPMSRRAYLVKKHRTVRRAIGSHTARYHVQVQRGTAWVTLAQFPAQGAAKDYGMMLARKYRSKRFRVFW